MLSTNMRNQDHVKSEGATWGHTCGGSQMMHVLVGADDCDRSGHGGDVIAHIVLQFPTHHCEPSVGLLHAFKLG